MFSVPPTRRSIESGKYVDYHPINTIAEGAPTKFEIPGAGKEYTDLCNCMIYVRLKVIKQDRTDLGNDMVVAPVNLFLRSLFSQVDVFLNGTPVMTASDIYGYRAYIETLLLYGEVAKKSQLTSSLFYKDDPQKFDVSELAGNDANSGFVKRRTFIRANQWLDMIGHIHADLFFQDRYLINQVNVKLRFIRSQDTFALVEADENRIIIADMVLCVRKQ